jgi:pimeloyl-ACP methyl ester carboxylesterase
MLKDISIRLPHIELAALTNRETIDCEKPTLIFLHGYLDSAGSFETLMPLLKEYQCIAVDLAGHGKSQHRSEDAHYHLIDFAYDIYQLVLSLNLSKFVLVGHSLGAIVSSIYASTTPPGLRGFVAIESCGPLAEDPETTALQITKCFDSRHHANKKIKHPASLDAVIKARCAISDLSAKHAKQIVSRNLVKDVQAHLQWRTDKRLRTTSPIRMTEEQARSILKNIQCPRVIILGNKGFEKVKVAIEQREAEFAGVPVVSFDGGHHVHLDSEQKVADCIDKQVASFFKA